MTNLPNPKRHRGRPEREWPDPIPDTPENVARAIMQGPPKKEWQFLKNKPSRKTKRGPVS